MFKIVNDFEGANCNVLSVSEHEVNVEVELRDTVDDWFFWCFKVEGAAGRTLTFKFPSWNRVGYFGAAISYDFENWHWQYSTSGHDGDTFVYSFDEGENEVYFAHDMIYRPSKFISFAEKNKLEIKEWCISEKGRSVPFIEFGKGDEAILLTARHHACESTGNYVLEGAVEELKKSLADRFKVICIPFVDLDGVVEGDQGKNRNGHDHSQDYNENEEPIYQSVLKIRGLAGKLKVRFAFDFHSPWHLYGSHDTVFFTYKHYDAIKRLARFSKLFEEESKKSGLPHLAKDDYLPDVEWNKFGAPSFGTFWGLHGAELSCTLETPYFMATGIPFSPEKAVETGRNFVKALEKYIL